MSSYGISKNDLVFCQNKLDIQKTFLQNSKFVNSFGEVKSLLDFSLSANFSKNYYAEVTNRVNTLSNLSRDCGLMPVFLTVTLNGCFRGALCGDFSKFELKDIKSLPYDLKYKFSNNIAFNIRDLCYYLNYRWNLFITRFQSKYKGIERAYIRVFEPHKKDGVPHLHCLFYAPKHTMEYLFKCFCDIFYAPQNLKQGKNLTKEQRDNGETNGFQWSLTNPTGYVMKYITKTFINFNKSQSLDELSAWYVKHKVRRFLTSHTPVPLWVYRKINFIKSLRDFTNVCNMRLDDETCVMEWDFKSDFIMFTDTSTSQELIYENGHLLYYKFGRLIAEYKKETMQTIDKSYEIKDKPMLKKKLGTVEANSTPLNKIAFSKMGMYDIVDYYLHYDHTYENPQRLAILENEMIKRGFSGVIKLNERHNLNDIDKIVDNLSNRGVIPLNF